MLLKHVNMYNKNLYNKNALILSELKDSLHNDMFELMCYMTEQHIGSLSLFSQIFKSISHLPF